MKQLSTFLLAIICFNNVYSQSYKTLLLPKDDMLSGSIQMAELPQNVPLFELLTRSKSNYWQDSLLLSSKKVVRFQVNTKDYQHNDWLYVQLITKNPEVLTAHSAQLSAYYETDSLTFIQEMYSKNHAQLQPNHLFSLQIDTTKSTLYIVLLFDPSFSGKFTFQLTTRVKHYKAPVPYKFGFRNCFYYHPYDYGKQPFPFVEALCAPKQQFAIQASLKLYHQAFEEPIVAEGSDSLFFNTLMNNIIALARENQIKMYYLETPILFQLQFDQNGQLLDVQASACAPHQPCYLQHSQEIHHDIERILEVVPKTFRWNPASNFNGEPIAYTREFILYMDTFWN